jgi:hypothetical protein
VRKEEKEIEKMSQSLRRVWVWTEKERRRGGGRSYIIMSRIEDEDEGGVWKRVGQERRIGCSAIAGPCRDRVASNVEGEGKAKAAAMQEIRITNAT